jgi:hypothetical protein
MDPEASSFGDALVDCLQGFTHRPHWIAVVNINALGKVAQSLEKTFLALKTRPIRAFDLHEKALNRMLKREFPDKKR